MKGVLPTRTLEEVGIVTWGKLLLAGTTTLCSATQASCSLSSCPRAARSPPFPSLSCAACTGNQQSAGWCCLQVVMGLQLQGGVTQRRCRCRDPLPWLPCAVRAWQHSWCWAGEPPTCAEAASPGKPASPTAVMRAGCLLRLSELWGRAAVGSGGLSCTEILRVCSPLARCLLRGWMGEPDFRQVWLCEAGGRSV